jgi:hypothetical protein
VNWKKLGLLTALAALLEVAVAGAATMNVRVFEINDHLLSFYDGRPAETATPAGKQNWADFGAMNVGVGYVCDPPWGPGTCLRYLSEYAAGSMG